MSDNINKFEREILGGISPFIYLTPFLYNLDCLKERERK